ncbi:hypothetical protein BX600DRAFT_440474 [Xylariales sp. PMI_506]|nr:hypothetical protein BX600DRAFT_440474 [Xylariales sp. PMI_506]
MWTSYGPPPVYTVPQGKRRNTQTGQASAPTAEPSSPNAAAVPKSLQHSAELMEPSVDGPPSPGHIRALSRQTRQTSIAERRESHHTSSSGSSSRVSLTERPSWELGAEQLTLSRKSSQRSTTSSMPSRERPESVQIFGKTLFNRRPRIFREDSDQGSPNSSSTSVDTQDTTPGSSRDPNFLNSMIGRRRTGTESSQKKFQISGPYNFQHLTHTEKNDVPELNRSNRMDLVSDFSEMRPAPKAPVPPPKDNQAGQWSVSEDPSAGLRYANNNGTQTRPSHTRAQTWQKPSSPPPVPARSIKRAQSQEQIRQVPPPRPPRSPIEQSFTSPIPPPSRLSSRTSSLLQSHYDGLTTINLERPITNNGFRQPRPFIMPSQSEVVVPALSPQSSPKSLEKDASAGKHRFSHAVTTPNDVAWPMGTNATVSALPDVPEEEEVITKKSRVSIASNSSLRGSISVPLLRQMAQPQGSSQRPPSNASETLGRFDLLAAQRALRSDSDNESLDDELPRETWEDDIDYCYDHAVEADCDYAWERPSCDMLRLDEEALEQAMPPFPLTNGTNSPALLSPPGRDDLPALSPTSQFSNGSRYEARTPTIPAVTSNFSLPRRDSSAIIRGHDRKMSHAESFRESQGFDLSPSLLIPSDYHQQMLLHERAELRDQDDSYLAPFSTSGLHFAKSPMTLKARSSASTTDSALSDRSATSKSHKSNNSASTTLTHWTTNSNGDGCNTTLIEEEPTVETTSETAIMAALPELDVTRAKRDQSREGHLRTQSHANLLVKSGSEGTMFKPIKEAMKSRRRANTATSKTHHQAGPISLFPAMMGSRM